MIKEADNKNLQLVTTEKDFYRIKDFSFNKIDFLEIDLIKKEKEKFIDDIISNL